MIFKTAKNIEEFKENEKHSRIIFLIISLISLLGIYLSVKFGKESYQSGFFTGLFATMIIILIKSIILSRNESKIKSKFINTYDERNLLILQKASQVSISISIIAISMASFIISIFNIEIAIALGIASISIVLILLITATIIKKKL